MLQEKIKAIEVAAQTRMGIGAAVLKQNPNLMEMLNDMRG